MSRSHIEGHEPIPILPLRNTNQALKMFSGKLVWPLDFRPDDLDLNDVVRGMSRENRFAGQTAIPINVCWHSLNLSHVVPKAMALPALVHDMTEAYMKDLPRPLKNHPAFAFFEPLEHKLFSQMCSALNLPFTVLPTGLKQIDVDIGSAEMYMFNPRGYEILLKTGVPKDRHLAVMRLVKKIGRLIETEMVPGPTQVSATRKAWMARFRDLSSKHG